MNSQTAALVERLEALVACNCDFEERFNAAILPTEFVGHANWCNRQRHGADAIVDALAALADAPVPQVPDEVVPVLHPRGDVDERTAVRSRTTEKRG